MAQRITLTKDWMNKDIQVDRFFALRGTEALGWLETNGADWAAFKACGEFIDWFRTKREALGVIS